MKHDTAPLSAQDAAELYKLITGQESDKDAYAPLAERTELAPRFSADLLRRIDAALLGTPAAAARCALPIGAQIALYALTICCIPALVIGAAQLRTPAAAPAAVQTEVQNAEEERLDEAVESDGLLPEPPEEITPAPKPQARPKSLAKRIQKRMLTHKAKAKSKKAAPADKTKKAAAPKKKPAAQKRADKAKKSSATTKQRGNAAKTKKKDKPAKARNTASPKQAQDAPLLSPEEELQQSMQLPAGAAYRVLPRRLRRMRAPAYYRY